MPAISQAGVEPLTYAAPPPRQRRTVHKVAVWVSVPLLLVAVTSFTGAVYWMHVSDTAIRVGARVIAGENFSICLVAGLIFSMPGVCLLAGGLRGSRPATTG